MNKKDNYAPILPFDVTSGENFQIYKKVTYIQDKALCGENSIQMESGNIFKYYELKEAAPVKIGGY